jgi:hypothetical protein
MLTIVDVIALDAARQFNGTIQIGGGTMPRYVIERNIPGAGQMSAAELRAVSQTSVGILNEIGPDIRWFQSYVTDDKIYCIYEAPSAALIEEHARCMGMPANRISEVRAMVDPTTASG